MMFDLSPEPVYKIPVKKLKAKPFVLHHQTCPYCDRKLVNTYRVSKTDIYICKKCMDKITEEFNNV